MGLQRVLALFVLCTIFGASVWMSTASSTPASLQIATAASGGASFKNVGEGQCPPPSATRAYNPSAPKYPRQYCGVPSGNVPVAYGPEGNLAGAALALACMPPKKPITNLYGKPCTFKEGELTVTGECLRAGWCKGKSYKDQQNQNCPLSDPPKPCTAADKAKLDELKKGMEGASAANDLDRMREIETAYNALKYPEETKELGELQKQLAAAEAEGDDAAAQKIEERMEELRRNIAVAEGNTKIAELTEKVYSGGPAKEPLPGRIGNLLGPEDAGRVTNQPSAGDRIQNIANTPPSGGERVWNPTGPQSTFNPSPILNNIANWGGIPSGGGSASFGNGPSMGPGQAGGYAPSGGPIAYVPVNQYPGLTSPNFDGPTAVNFPEPRPTPEEILENLAKNTKRMPGEKVTAAELRGGIVDSVVLRALDNFVTPVGQFIRSFFAGAEDEGLSKKDVAAAEGEEKEKKSPLERGRLVLALGADDSLVPGDPSQLEVGGQRRTYEAFESIPASNRAWVESAPQAREGIGRIANAPTYGWEDVPEDEDAGVGPDVADTGYEPFAAQGDLFPSLGAADEEGESKSFFSVMGKSFGTIGEAVNKLFRRISSALLWWL